jgi:hypothetical protein
MAKVMEFWINNWMKFSGSQSNLETFALTALVIGGALSNDVLLGMPKTIPQIFTFTAPGDPGVPVKFAGDGGSYRARFAKRA